MVSHACHCVTNLLLVQFEEADAFVGPVAQLTVPDLLYVEARDGGVQVAVKSVP
jgi:hypothetical protein